VTVLTEGDLRISFPAGAQARKFDDSSHGLLNRMKAVDFVVELPDRYWFVESKDPQAPSANSADSQQFVGQFLSGAIDKDLKYKYRDSFLYEWASGRADKPTYYLVLVAMDTLSVAELTTRTDELRRNLPLRGPGSAQWQRPFVAGCAVFNIDTWNRHHKDYPISRLSASP